VVAATLYELNHRGFPPAYDRDFSSGETTTWESHLWDLGTEYRVQQCPSFTGEAMWPDDRYTGYNYNASYVGGRTLRRGSTPLPGGAPSASMASVKDPARCALFGDGQYESGANKFMRSPYPGRLDQDASLALAGTQGFRHSGRTNVGFADGHAESLMERWTLTAASGDPAEGCGFLSRDNSLYDLD
jgi:prepilin-type processing-associated H-X9-DG protein